VAKTGSGKTLAFMIPCIAKTLQLKTQINEGTAPFLYFGGPLALVMAPTRELAIQIYNAAACLALCSGLKMSLVYGGATKESQLGPLNAGVDVLIATPGRLADFLNEGLVNLAHVSFFVLDEADRMLDMGFMPQVRRIAMFLSPGRQSMLLSATWPVEVEALSREICAMRPAKIKIGSTSLTINDAITQTIVQVNDSEKRKQLIDLLKEVNDSKSKIIIFVRTKKSSDRLSKFLDYEGYHADSIHGDKLQSV
jgi:ATP-dependent RNA helicase DDX5/DBP2